MVPERLTIWLISGMLILSPLVSPFLARGENARDTDVVLESGDDGVEPGNEQMQIGEKPVFESLAAQSRVADVYVPVEVLGDLAYERQKLDGTARVSIIPSELDDPAYRQYVDIRLLQQALKDSDSQLLTDVVLQLEEGERVLMRSHKAIPAVDVLPLRSTSVSGCFNRR
jgi:hypothetical protein